MTDHLKAMQVVELSASNFLRLKAVRIRPDGALVEVTGKNGAGKTSTLAAMCWAIGGKDFALEDPLRHGTDRGEVVVDLGELKITKTMERKGEEVVITLTVQNRDGSRPRQPQHILDELRGMAIDPGSFMFGKPADRLRMVRSLFPEFDFDAHERERKRVFQERTDVNRDLKRETAQRDAIVLPAGSAPAAVDVVALDRALANANGLNATLATRRRNREAVAANADAKRDEAERLRVKARELDAEADVLDKRVAEAEALPAAVDTAPILAQIAHASEINERARKFSEYERRIAEVKRLEEEADDLTAMIRAMDEAKTAAMAGGKLPFPGLAVAEDDVAIDGTVWEQVAFSTRLRASAAIGMALDPPLRVMFVREYGSLLDTDSRLLLTKLAAENGYQVWMEVCDEHKPGQIVIEDGEVKT